MPRGQYISESNKMLILMRTNSGEPPLEGFKGRFKTDAKTVSTPGSAISCVDAFQVIERISVAFS